MTMHLVRGMSSLSTHKRKDKIDLVSMESEWRSYNKDLRRRNLASMQFTTLESYIQYRFGSGKKVTEASRNLPTQSSGSFIRQTDRMPSLSSQGGTTAKKEPPKYSGDYLVGIATMHKSNMVAVGKSDCPISYSTMRRS